MKDTRASIICLKSLSGGGGVPPACSKPDSVAIRLMAKKPPCPNFEINTEFNWLVYGAITTNMLHVLWYSKVWKCMECMYGYTLIFWGGGGGR